MPQIRIWVYDGVLASGVAGPIDIFNAANAIWADSHGDPRGSGPLFEWRVESINGQPVRSASGQMVAVDGPISARAPVDAIVVTGPYVGDVAVFLEKLDGLEPLFAALRKQHERGAILASYCSGSFVLAEAGLLDGRVATTHWKKARAFEKRYPNVDLRPNELLTEHSRILCSGAVTSYLNLALRLVERLAGPKLAAETAKLLLIDTSRTSQAPYATLPEQDEDDGHGDQLVARGQRWMERHLHERFNLTELAEYLSVSERTVNRRFKMALGMAPLRYMQLLRVQVAKRLLETRRLNVDDVCERVGYGDISAFRQVFKRETGLSPGEYQLRFSPRRHARTVPFQPGRVTH